MKSLTKNSIATLIFVSSIAFCNWLQAGLTEAEVARLGADLTPVGGEKAGNSAGTIPEWTGGITEPPPGYQAGQHLVDPFAADEPLFVISAENVDQYQSNLSFGHQELLRTYPTFTMAVYPSRRSASLPQRVYDATKQFAATAELVDEGNGLSGAVIGTPFPIPKNGLEAIWNHLLRYRGVTIKRTFGQAAVTRGGAYTVFVAQDEAIFNYSLPGMTEDQLNNTMVYYKQEAVAPPRLAGGIILAHETLNRISEPRKAWFYSPGQRRVRRAPDVGYDTPATSADNLRTYDQFDMFNGAVDRYNWELVGKKELFIPYNSYKLNNSELSFTDILTPFHPSPEHLRYELHRVWVVEATLKEGAQHVYKRRTFYIDEDSWQVAVVDLYDNRDQFYRVSEGHALNFYQNPLTWLTLVVHYDLQSGRYVANFLGNEYEPVQFGVELSTNEFTPAAVRRQGKR